MVVMARDAALYREGLAAAAKAIKDTKGKAKPKVVRPGSIRSATEKGKEVGKVKLDRLRKSGKMEDAAAAIADFL
jgi:hypothetical protein